MSSNRLSIPAGSNQIKQLTNSVVIITGAGRSGKTLVGNLLGSCHNVEHLDEPWLPMTLPVLAGQGALTHTLAIDMFRASVVELWYDRLLMRHVNFRPADLSSIWRQKGPEEIMSRLVGLYSREDVRRYANVNRPSLVLTLTNTLPYLDFFHEALPGCRIIHVVREGVDVAVAVARKGWLSDEELLDPKNAQPYRPYYRSQSSNVYYLPWWLEEGQEELFLGLSEFERGLLYWRRLMELLEDQAVGRTADSPLVVKLADVVDRPQETIQSLLESLGFTETEFTHGLLSKVMQDEVEEPPAGLAQVLEPADLMAVREIYLRLGLPVSKLDRIVAGTAPQAH